jgi:hypothetical protein
MDLTMCRDFECPLREKCLRYNGEANPLYQSYFVKSPRKEQSCISGEEFILCQFYYESSMGYNITEIDKINKEKTEKGYVLEYIEDNLKAGVSVKEEELKISDFGPPIGGYVEEIKPKQQVMYMCYVVGGRNPTYRHDTLESAEIEAERLAKLTGNQVIILRSYLEVMVEVKTRITSYLLCQDIPQ